MEKIYEENNQSQKPKRISFSVVLSFAVALFAVVSLIAVGFSQISYAAEGDSNKTVHFGKFGTEDAEIIANNNEDPILEVPMMFFDSSDATTAREPVFCIEHGKDAGETEGAYSSDGEVYDDLGLIYIMNKSRVLGGSGIVPSTVKYPSSHTHAGEQLSANDLKDLETYATQIAIWLHMHETYSSGDRHGRLDATTLSLIEGASNLYSTRDYDAGPIFSGNLYTAYIKPVVDAAANASNYKTVHAVLASKSISLVGDSDIYQTDKINVVATPSDDLVNYSVDLYNLDGAYVVDKDGNKKTGLDTFAPGEYFYIRVPVNKITDTNKTVDIVITGEFSGYLGGEYFVADGQQAIVSVTSENFRVANSESIDFMVAPDTGMTTAQTIYFIGLIVLLCGVGIIYANAKPVEEK